MTLINNSNGNNIPIDQKNLQQFTEKVVADLGGAITAVLVYIGLNGYIRFESDILPGSEYEHTGIDAIPRPYIRVEDDATGTTNITNSEIASWL